MEQVTSLTDLAEEQLAAAREASAGRSAPTVYGGRERTLRQTLLALREGQALADHDSPGDATLQVLRGRVRLATADESWELGAGELRAIPELRHRLDALTDAAVLLTVATR